MLPRSACKNNVQSTQSFFDFRKSTIIFESFFYNIFFERQIFPWIAGFFHVCSLFITISKCQILSQFDHGDLRMFFILFFVNIYTILFVLCEMDLYTDININFFSLRHPPISGIYSYKTCCHLSFLFYASQLLLLLFFIQL